MNSQDKQSTEIIIDWPAQDEYMLEVVQKSHNMLATALQLNQSCISENGMLQISKGRWSNLKGLMLINNDQEQTGAIRNKGCKYLSRISLPNITNIVLCRQFIEASGVHHLSKAPWGKLLQLYLDTNQLGTESIKMLIRHNWKDLETMSFQQNNLTEEEAKWILISHVEQLELCVGYNQIDEAVNHFSGVLANKAYNLDLSEE